MKSSMYSKTPFNRYMQITLISRLITQLVSFTL